MSSTAFYTFCLVYAFLMFLMVRAWNILHDRIYRTVPRKDGNGTHEEFTRFGRILNEVTLIVAVTPWFILGLVLLRS